MNEPLRHACRFCSAPLEHVFADLGMTPLANSYLAPGSLRRMEPFYPLRALVCERCLLVQLEDYETPDTIFSDYAYFSSYSTSWLDHARRYVEKMTAALALGSESLVVELASNDGYLLQYFHERRIQVLGVEPAANVAKVALQKGIPTVAEFFGVELATELAERSKADLLLGNNVLAHVPDLNDFVGGMKILLAAEGTITMEFPHLVALMEHNEWDTIYHEHFSYFSFGTVRRIFERHGLRVFDVEELPTHGGSLRIYAAHGETGRSDSDAAQELLDRERGLGLEEIERYTAFAAKVPEEKRELLRFLLDLKGQGLSIAGYGAPAKGNTLLNYCGVGTELLDYTVDKSPHKQGLHLPGTHIPILAPERIFETRPDIVFILPWNLREEISDQMTAIREWGGRFATRTPELRVWE